MKRIFLCISLMPSILLGQKVINVEHPAAGSIVLSPNMTMQKIKSGYTLWLPRGDSKGVVVVFQENRDTTNKISLIDLALKNQLATLFVTTDNPVDFLFEEVKIKELEGYI